MSRDAALELELCEVGTAAHRAAEWPVAAGMLQFAGVAAGGDPMSEADPAEWRAALSSIRYEGLTAVELSSRWIDLAKLGTGRRRELAGVLDELGLAVPGYLVAGRSVIDPEAGGTNLATTHESIDAAAEFGIGVVCIGLHPFSPGRPGGPLWFWTDQDPEYHDDPDRWSLAVRRVRELAEHAGQAGVALSVETYPGTLVGSGQLAARFLVDVDNPALGVNPDLGNLVRVQAPIEPWELTSVQLLPLANYWHVKNYARAENPFTGTVTTHPAGLADGVVNYRKALRFALANGFSGPIVVEHYGGDGLAVSGRNARYLRRLLAWILQEPVGQPEDGPVA